MICDRCHGRGSIRRPVYVRVLLPDPQPKGPLQWREEKVVCLDCMGSGVLHCCEGERPDEHS